MFVMHPELEAALRSLREDGLSGASSLAYNSCACLKAFCERRAGADLRADLEEFAVGLAAVQPNMGSMWNLANGVLQRSKDAGQIIGFCSSMMEHHSCAALAIADHAATMVSGKKVMTTSSSNAVFHTLVKASGLSPASVTVCESRPMREGVVMARELANAGVQVKVIADAALALFSADVEVAMVGADAVNKHGVIGKIGLMHLAMACEARAIPMVVLADSTKFAPIDLAEDQRDPSELLEPFAQGVVAENRYFEQVGFAQISSMYSEKGRLSAEDAQRAVWGVSAHPKLAGRAQ